MTRTSLAALNADHEGFLGVLGGVFEHSPWVAEAVMAQRPFASLAGLDAAMAAALRAGTLTQHSTAEQAAAGLVNLSAADAERFTRQRSAQNRIELAQFHPLEFGGFAVRRYHLHRQTVRRGIPDIDRRRWRGV